MTTIQTICDFMEQFAPTSIAEDWDNVGLLIGERPQTVVKVMTCLTVTPESVAEAIEKSANLIVAHHPMPFQAIRQITSDSTAGKMILDLARHSIGVYSPHTGFDSAHRGINHQIAERFGLQQVRALKPIPETELGSGRIGRLDPSKSLGELMKLGRDLFSLEGLHYVGETDSECTHVAIACGSGGSFLDVAIQAGADTFVTGETNFHTCLEARARGIKLLLVGHFASERFAVEYLAKTLSEEFPEMDVWASSQESDPVRWA